MRTHQLASGLHVPDRAISAPGRDPWRPVVLDERVFTLDERLASAERSGMPVMAGGAGSTPGFTFFVEEQEPSAASPKTMLYVKGGATRPFIVCEMGLTFDGTSGVWVMALTMIDDEKPETGTGTELTAVATRGIGQGQGLDAKGWRSFGTEPKVATKVKYLRGTLPTGTLIWQFPQGREPGQTVLTQANGKPGKAIGMQLYASVACKASCWFEVEE